MPHLWVYNPKVSLDFEFERAIGIGRHIANSLPLPDREVSRRHAQIYPENGHYLVSDLGSKNGVFLNGHKVREPQTLSAGDEICLGGSVLLFDPPEGSKPEFLLSKRGSDIHEALPPNLKQQSAAVCTFSPAELNDIAREWFDGQAGSLGLPRKTRTPLLRLAIELNDGRHRGDVARRALDSLGQTVGAERAVFVEAGRRRQDAEILASRFEEEGEEEEGLEPAVDVLRIVLDAGKAAYCTRCGDDFRFKHLLHNDDEYLIGSFVVVPVVCAGKTRGFIYLDQPGGGAHYAMKDLLAAWLTARIAATALHWHSVGRAERDSD